jgi:general secretion pathway protein L
MSQLLITLSTPDIASADLAYALASNGGALTSHGRAAPPLLPKAEMATLIVPAQAISWHLAALPKLPRGSSAQKLQAVLAGVLEEQLLDEAGQVHLVACPELSSDGKTWVAACDKAWLLSAVKALQAVNVPVNSILPQVFPTVSASLHVSGTTEAAWITYSDSQGVLTLPIGQASSVARRLSAKCRARCGSHR